MKKAIRKKSIRASLQKPAVVTKEDLDNALNKSKEELQRWMAVTFRDLLEVALRNEKLAVCTKDTAEATGVRARQLQEEVVRLHEEVARLRGILPPQIVNPDTAIRELSGSLRQFRSIEYKQFNDLMGPVVRTMLELQRYLQEREKYLNSNER